MKRDRELPLPLSETEHAELLELARLLGGSPQQVLRRAAHDRLLEERARVGDQAPEEGRAPRRRGQGSSSGLAPGERYVERDDGPRSPGLATTRPGAGNRPS